MIADAVCAEITALPTYGYRRAGSLGKPSARLIGMRRVNHKRVYRVMKAHGFLLPRRQSAGTAH